MQSIKNGNDYTQLLDEAAFVRELKDQLSFGIDELVGTDGDGNLILEIKNIKAKFIFDKSLKTKVSYEILYQYYLMGKPVLTDTFNIIQESRYNLKF